MAWSHARLVAAVGALLMLLLVAGLEQWQPCFMRFEHPQLENKSIDFENPSVFELLASNYSQQRSPFLQLLHRERECVALSYWINNEPDSAEFRGTLRFLCGIQELLRIELLHVPNEDAWNGYCLGMRHADRPLEQFGCDALRLSRTAPLTLQAHVGSMVVLSQRDTAGLDYLLFQRVVRHQDMLNTLKYFEAVHQLPRGTLGRRDFYTSRHWLRCDCEQLVRDLAPLYQCLGVSRDRLGRAELTMPSLSDDMLVMAAIGIGAGVTLFLLLKIRMIC